LGRKRDPGWFPLHHHVRPENNQPVKIGRHAVSVKYVWEQLGTVLRLACERLQLIAAVAAEHYELSQDLPLERINPIARQIEEHGRRHAPCHTVWYWKLIDVHSIRDSG
jgi:hypothetical protein